MTKPEPVFEIHVSVSVSDDGLAGITSKAKDLITSVEKVVSMFEKIAPLIKMAAALRGQKASDQ
jgi:hypothetical protein